MKNYLRFDNNTHYSLRHDFTSIFKRFEFLFFCLLTVACIISSSLHKESSRKISEFFIGISLPVIDAACLPINVTIDLLTNFKELAQARNDNEMLRAENEKLRSFFVQSLNIHNENKALRKTLGFITSKTLSYKVAHVNGRSHAIFNQTLTIDSGQNNGLKEGSLVSGTKGLIGRIDEVFENGSRILLATNAKSRIPIITSNARVRGVLAGNNSSVMKILYLQKDHGIQAGDRVFTSGDGESLPPGILVGVVRKVAPSYASVELVENVGNIDIVTILDYSLKEPKIVNPVETVEEPVASDEIKTP